MKFDKVQSYVAENDLDQEIRASWNPSEVFYIEKKEIMPMLTRLEDVKIPLILIMIKLNQCR
jgi:hypothetical protein